MRYCSSCGHELGVGRFCTNCGQPIDRSGASHHAGSPGADTEERRAARLDAALVPTSPRTPPAANDTPAPPRFPLYADEVPPPAGATDPVDLADASAATAPPTRETGGGFLDRFGQADREPDSTAHAAPDRTADEALAALHAAAEHDDEPHHQRRRGPWSLVALLVVVVVIALLAWLGTRDVAGGATGPDALARSGQATEPRDVAADATVRVPGTAPDAREAGGGRASFDAANMLDGDPTTAWRVAGNASGEKITFTFDEPVTISQVGIINGYAKTGVGGGGKAFDWYHGNRTIAEVAWVFDDGTTLDQSLARNRRMQSLDVDDVTTSSLTLRIVEVRSPGNGRASRNYTAISDVSLVGLPAR